MTHMGALTIRPRESAHRFTMRHVALEVHLAHMKKIAPVSHKTHVLACVVGFLISIAHAIRSSSVEQVIYVQLLALLLWVAALFDCLDHSCFPSKLVYVS